LIGRLKNALSQLAIAPQASKEEITMASQQLARRSSVGSFASRRSEMKSSSDRTLRESIKGLQESSVELEGLNDNLRQALDLPTDRTKSFMARCMHLIVPKSFYPSLPNGLVRFMAEEYDVLELIGSLQRRNVNNTQEALRSLAIASITKKEEIEQLRADIQRAREENWDARQLQQFVAERAEILIYEEIGMLFDNEFDVLGDEERELRKQQLLDQLEANTVIAGELVRVMRATCSAGLSILHRAVGHYFDYVTVYRPVAELRDAAKTLTDTNKGMYVAKDAIITTFQASVDAIRKSVKAAQLVNSYSLVSGDMGKMLDDAQELIAYDTKAISSSLPKRRELPVIEASVVAEEASQVATVG